MPKITISSTRVYYKDLYHDDALTIHYDIVLYHSMLHKAYHNNIINSKHLKNIATIYLEDMV